MRDRLAARGFSGTVPVFPLPGAVLFPGVVLPLHIFEPRYRAMLRDARAGEGLIALATLRDEADESAGPPPFHPLATVGLIGGVEDLPDGRSNIALAGLERVRLTEVASEHAYRLARAEVVHDEDPPADDPALDESKRRLLLTFAYYLQLARPDSGPLALGLDTITFEAAVHTVCQFLELPTGARLRALAAAGPRQRLELVRPWLAGRLDRALQKRGVAGLSLTGGEHN